MKQIGIFKKDNLVTMRSIWGPLCSPSFRNTYILGLSWKIITYFSLWEILQISSNKTKSAWQLLHIKCNNWIWKCILAIEYSVKYTVEYKFLTVKRKL